MNNQSNICIVAKPEQDCDIYYASGFMAPDPVIYFETKGKKYLVLSDLEIDRAKKSSKVDEVLSISYFKKKLGVHEGTLVKIHQILGEIFKEYNISEVTVPDTFPLAIADGLRHLNFKVTTKEPPFFPQRTIKTSLEIKHIKETQKAVERAVHKAENILVESEIIDNKLIHEGKVVTSEMLRSIIDTALFKDGYQAQHSIVASGLDSIDPHSVGHGPIVVGSTLIIDIFPQSTRTQYFADMTRTFYIGGEPPKEIQKQYNTVLQGQKIAYDMIKPGCSGAAIHKAIEEYFNENGYETGEKDGRMHGFFHGTGHGLGLEIHELPRISKVDSILLEGHVVTVEPGLYYKDTGGIRLEDLVVVTDTGFLNLTKYPKSLIPQKW